MRQPLKYKGDNDYALAEGEASVWIEVDGVSLYIRRRDNEIAVTAYPLGSEDQALLGEFVVSAWGSL